MGLDEQEKPICQQPKSDETTSKAHLKPVWMGILPAVTMAEDNQTCLSLIANSETTRKAKNIDIAHHMVRERVEMGEVKFAYTPGAEVLADGLTKALPGPAFNSFRSRLGVGTTEAPTPEDDPAL